MSLEGELAIVIGWDGRAVRRVRVDSTRPDIAGRVLTGREADEVLALVPRLYSICSASQRIAAQLAVRAARGDAPSDTDLSSAQGRVGAEMVREYAWRVLVDWPRLIGEEVDQAAVRRIREDFPDELLALEPRAARRIACAVFGGSADAWLAPQRIADLDPWMAAGETCASRLLATLRPEDRAIGASDCPLLRFPSSARERDALMDAVTNDPGFARFPTQDGQPAETGPLARRSAAGDPLVAGFGHSTFARFVARLRDLAALLAARTLPRVCTWSARDGMGAACLENARGMLLHFVELDGARTRRYRIVAPTEWNFHPAGALALGLRDTRHAGEAELRRRTELLVQALDPCVRARLEFEHA